MPTKMVPESCDLMNKNTSQAKSECQLINLSTSRLFKAAVGGFRDNPDLQT